MQCHLLIHFGKKEKWFEVRIHEDSDSGECLTGQGLKRRKIKKTEDKGLRGKGVSWGRGYSVRMGSHSPGSSVCLESTTIKMAMRKYQSLACSPHFRTILQDHQPQSHSGISWGCLMTALPNSFHCPILPPLLLHEKHFPVNDLHSVSISNPVSWRPHLRQLPDAFS